jgi:hypothetical protein
MFHLPKSVFNVMLAPVSQDDLFVRPVVVVGEQDRFSQLFVEQS